MDSAVEKWTASNFETTTLRNFDTSQSIKKEKKKTLTHPRLFIKQKQRGLRLC